MKRWKLAILVALSLIALIGALPVYNSVVERATIAAAGTVTVGMTRAQVQGILGRPQHTGMGFSTHTGSSRIWDQDCFGGPALTIKRGIDRWLYETGRDAWRDRLGTAGRQRDWAVIVVYDDQAKVRMVVTRGRTIAPVGAADPVELF